AVAAGMPHCGEGAVGGREGDPHDLAAERRRQPVSQAQRFARDRADFAVALLDEDEDAHSSFASSRSSRTSSGIAAAPSPTMRPAARAAGSARAKTSRFISPSWAGFSSIGFFFAAMMPLSEA